MSESPQMHSDDPPAVHADELPGPVSGHSQKRWVFLGIAALGLALPLLLLAPFGLGLDFEVELPGSDYVFQAYDVREPRSFAAWLHPPRQGFGTYVQSTSSFHYETAYTLRIGNRVLGFSKHWSSLY